MRRFPAFFLLLALLSGCYSQDDPPHGYVEGEYLSMAPTSSGLLAELSVRRGQKIAAGDPLFTLDMTSLNASYLAAKAQVDQAKAQWQDLLKGSRPEEIEIILKQQDQAKATLEAAAKEYERAQTLSESNAVSRQSYDEAKAAFETAQARTAELDAELKKAALGAREDEIAAARAALDNAEQNLVQLDKQRKDAAPMSPMDAYVEDTFFNVGEYVAAGTPVVSLLPPDKVKIRFFVPQASLSHYPLGKSVEIACDGCDHTVKAKVNYISSSVEYTPPVIYSIGSRDKLVVLVEAQPDTYDPLLKPGLPVDIRDAVP
ncbi:MAG: HlyD family secretion protein [Bdellovibrionales bacterium]